MKYVLDTNILSFAMMGEEMVIERLLSEARTDVFLPAPALAEIEYGLARLPNSRRRDRLRHRLEELVRNASIAPWTREVILAFGRIKAQLETRGQRIEDFDIAIAAHALASDAVLVTDNIAHMGRIPGIRLKNWRS